MPTHSEAMLAAFPHPIELNKTVLHECVQACFDCVQTCTTCANACLAERDVQNLVRCIRLNQDCADVCDATGRLLSRYHEPDNARLRHLLQLCQKICEVCATECEKHAHHHEHCAVCAQACRQCAGACAALLPLVPNAEPALP